MHFLISKISCWRETESCDLSLYVKLVFFVTFTREEEKGGRSPTAKLYRKYIVCKDNLNVGCPMKGATNT